MSPRAISVLPLHDLRRLPQDQLRLSELLPERDGDPLRLLEVYVRVLALMKLKQEGLGEAAGLDLAVDLPLPFREGRVRDDLDLVPDPLRALAPGPPAARSGSCRRGSCDES
jgi:hypothetical protein